MVPPVGHDRNIPVCILGYPEHEGVWGGKGQGQSLWAREVEAMETRTSQKREKIVAAVYGITTGFGTFANVRIDKNELE